MLAFQHNASETYRRIEFDARVEGANGVGLTRLCLERAIDEISRAETAHSRGDRHRMADALAKASASISALGSGIDASNPLRGPLQQLYGSAESAIRGAITQYRQDIVERVRGDLQDILALL